MTFGKKEKLLIEGTFCQFIFSFIGAKLAA
jgi:hypothetical protein